MPKKEAKDLKFKLASRLDAETISKLVNSAYRGDSSRAGWTTEADFLDGQRVDPEMIAEMISDRQIILLAYQDQTLIACVALNQDEQVCHLGMLTVTPKLQNQGIGAVLLAEAEKWALTKGCTEISMDVIHLRHELIEWYMRRGYRKTGETASFPYGNARFGLPLRDDLHFLGLSKKLQ